MGFNDALRFLFGCFYVDALSFFNISHGFKKQEWSISLLRVEELIQG